MRIKKSSIGILALVMDIALVSIGFSSWSIGTINAQTNVEAGVGTYSESALRIKITSTSEIHFDAEITDDDGLLVYGGDKEESLDLAVSGFVVDPVENTNWVSIRPSLSIDASHASLYESCIEKGYLQRPKFDDLPNDFDGGGANSYWTSRFIYNSSNYWEFTVNSTFEYGSFFNNLNPSLFFDGDDFNGEKLGFDYTKEEIKAILAELYALNGATYTITLSVITESNTTDLIFDPEEYEVVENGITPGEGQISKSNAGKLSSTGASDPLTVSNVAKGDYVYFPEAYKTKRAFLGFKATSSVGSQTYSFLGAGGQSYLFDDILSSLHLTSLPTTLTFLPEWSDLSATLTIKSPDDNSTGYTTPTCTYRVISSEYSLAGIKTRSIAPQVAGSEEAFTGKSEELKIGDTVILQAGLDSGIASISWSGFDKNFDDYNYSSIDLRKGISLVIAETTAVIVLVTTKIILAPDDWTASLSLDTSTFKAISTYTSTTTAGQLQPTYDSSDPTATFYFYITPSGLEASDITAEKGEEVASNLYLYYKDDKKWTTSYYCYRPTSSKLSGKNTNLTQPASSDLAKFFRWTKVEINENDALVECDTTYDSQTNGKWRFKGTIPVYNDTTIRYYKVYPIERSYLDGDYAVADPGFSSNSQWQTSSSTMITFTLPEHFSTYLSDFKDPKDSIEGESSTYFWQYYWYLYWSFGRLPTSKSGLSKHLYPFPFVWANYDANLGSFYSKVDSFTDLSDMSGFEPISTIGTLQKEGGPDGGKTGTMEVIGSTNIPFIYVKTAT